MTKSITRLLVVALLAGSLIGCSTVESISQGAIPEPYAGSSEAGDWVVFAVRPPDGWELTGMMVLPLFLMNFAASAAADTVLLPVTFPNAVFNANRSSDVLLAASQ